MWHGVVVVIAVSRGAAAAGRRLGEEDGRCADEISVGGRARDGMMGGVGVGTREVGGAGDAEEGSETGAGDGEGSRGVTLPDARGREGDIVGGAELVAEGAWLGTEIGREWAGERGRRLAAVSCRGGGALWREACAELPTALVERPAGVSVDTRGSRKLGPSR